MYVYGNIINTKYKLSLKKNKPIKVQGKRFLAEIEDI